MTTALQILVVVTLIGIIAGLAVTRYGRGWFGTRASDFTAALVGITGSLSWLSYRRCGGPHSCAGRGLSRRDRGSVGHPLGVAKSLAEVRLNRLLMGSWAVCGLPQTTTLQLIQSSASREFHGRE